MPVVYGRHQLSPSPRSGSSDTRAGRHWAANRRSAQHETFVTPGDHFDTLCDVEREAHDLVDVVDPLVLGPLRRFDATQASAAQVADAVGDPVDVLLDGGDQVGEHGGTPGAGDDEQVGEARGAEAQVGAWTGRSLFFEGLTAETADVDPVESSGHGVETGGEDDSVECVLGIADLQSLLCESIDGHLAHVDQVDVLAVEGLVVPGVDRTRRCFR